jgi:hypothetical protein
MLLPILSRYLEIELKIPDLQLSVGETTSLPNKHAQDSMFMKSCFVEQWLSGSVGYLGKRPPVFEAFRRCGDIDTC